MSKPEKSTPLYETEAIVTAVSTDEHGLSTTQSWVMCPNQQRPAGLKECRDCHQGFVVQAQGDAGPSYTLCKGDAGHEEKPEESSSIKKNIGELLHTTPVSQLMHPNVISADAEMPIERLIMLLVDNQISGVPVVNAAGIPIGMVSQTDLISDDYDWAELRDRVLSRDEGSYFRNYDQHPLTEQLFFSQSVNDIMTRGVVVIPEHSSISAAALIMAQRHIHRLPVVDNQGVLCGIVSTMDITRWVAENSQVKVGTLEKAMSGVFFNGDIGP